MKKKIICILICAAMCFGAFAAACNTQPAEEVPEAEKVSYTADFSGGVPGDWKLYSGCDVANVKAEGSDNAAVLTHSNQNVNANLYHGGVYEVATNSGSVANFELEMKFSFLSYDNDTRWLAVYYHTRQTDDGKLNGYLMNVRVNGNSAQSTVSSVPTYTDTENVDSKVVLTDKSEHTLKITVKDGVAVHSLDGNKTIEYSLISKSGLLGGYNGDGGFAVGVNRSSVKISLFNFTGEKGYGTHTAPTLAQTYSPETSLIAAPSVITRIKDEEGLKALKREARPATAVISVNDKFEVTGDNGVLGTLDEIYEEYFGTRVIPAVNITTQTQADKLIAWLNRTETVDIAVVSENAELVKTVRTAVPWVRGIVDYSTQNFVNPAKVVAETTSSLAHITVLSQSAATPKTVAALQGRFKTVWVQTANSTEFDASSVVSSGAYGIITQNTESAYGALKSYTDKNSMARVPFNIAHRGLPISSYENSVEGSLRAYNEGGATHVEIDLKLTSDKHIVIMHDDEISRTTTGQGIVSEMTLAQLRQYKIIKSIDGKTIGAGVNIPTLEEFFEEFRDKNITFVLELKTNDPELVSELKRVTDEYGYNDRIAVIAFDVEQLEEMKKVMPETPTADLNSVSSDALLTALYKFNYYNTTMDTGYGNASGEFLNRQLLDRGYAGFLWTYGSASDISAHFNSGVLGMTNNEATAFARYAKELTVGGRYILSEEGQSVGATVEAVVKNYAGEEESVTATVFKKNGDGSEIILSYRTHDSRGVEYTLYSEALKVVDANAFLTADEIKSRIDKLPAKVTKADAEEVESLLAAYNLLYGDDKAAVTNYEKLAAANDVLNGGNTTVIIVCCSVGGAVVIAGAAVAAVLLIKRKKKGVQ